MRNVDFTKTKGIEGVTKNFLISEDYLRKLLDANDQSAFYEELQIPKKSFKNRKDFRIVYKADPPVAQLQKNLASVIENNIHFPECVQGFVKGRSSLSNAKHHLCRKLLLNADIKNFFDSINIDRVIEVFSNLGCDSDTSKILAKICTRNGILSQGLHTSPTVSNIVVSKMDNDFLTLCEKHSATYTRYADDISISSDKSLPTKEEVSDILKNHGFELNENKFSIRKRGQAQYVTGLSVFDSRYPRIPKRMKRNLRLELYYSNKYGIESHFDKIGVPDYAGSYSYRRLRGTIDYINSIEPSVSQKSYKLLPYKPDYKCLAEMFIKNPDNFPGLLAKMESGNSKTN